MRLVGVTGEIAAACHFLTHESGEIIEDLRHLFPCNRVVGSEAAVAVTGDNAVIRRPLHIGAAPEILRHITEGGAVIIRRIHICHPSQNRYKHGSRHRQIGREHIFVSSFEQFAGGDKVDIRLCPVAVNVAEVLGVVDQSIVTGFQGQVEDFFILYHAPGDNIGAAVCCGAADHDTIVCDAQIARHSQKQAIDRITALQSSLGNDDDVLLVFDHHVIRLVLLDDLGLFLFGEGFTAEDVSEAAAASGGRNRCDQRGFITGNIGCVTDDHLVLLPSGKSREVVCVLPFDQFVLVNEAADVGAIHRLKLLLRLFHSLLRRLVFLGFFIGDGITCLHGAGKVLLGLCDRRGLRRLGVALCCGPGLFDEFIDLTVGRHLSAVQREYNVLILLRAGGLHRNAAGGRGRGEVHAVVIDGQLADQIILLCAVGRIGSIHRISDIEAVNAWGEILKADIAQFRALPGQSIGKGSESVGRSIVVLRGRDQCNLIDIVDAGGVNAVIVSAHQLGGINGNAAVVPVIVCGCVDSDGAVLCHQGNVFDLLCGILLVARAIHSDQRVGAAVQHLDGSLHDVSVVGCSDHIVT